MPRVNSPTLRIVLVLAGILPFSGHARAGFMQPRASIDFKEIIIQEFEEQIVERLSQVTYSSTLQTMDDPSASFVQPLINQERILVPAGTTTFTPVNFYPRLEVPQPVDLATAFVDVFWGFAANLGPLPPDVELLDAVMFGARTGTAFPAIITPINDLADLPTSSQNNLFIEWDLTPFTETTGNFFLAQVTMPIYEVIPEPSSVVLLGLGLLALGYRSWRRRQGVAA